MELRIVSGKLLEREALIWGMLASRDAAVCAERLSMWELIVMAMVSAVLSSKMLLSIALSVWNGAKRLQDA